MQSRMMIEELRVWLDLFSVWSFLMNPHLCSLVVLIEADFLRINSARIPGWSSPKDTSVNGEGDRARFFEDVCMSEYGVSHWEPGGISQVN